MLIKACDIVRSCQSSKAQLTQFGGAQANNPATRKWDKRNTTFVVQATTCSEPVGRSTFIIRFSSCWPALRAVCWLRPSPQERSMSGCQHLVSWLRHFGSFCQSLPRRAASAVSYQPGESPWIGDERGGTEMINPNFVEENYYVIHQLATHRAWKVRVVSKTLGVPLATFFHTSLSFACLPIVVVSVPDPLFAATVLRKVTSTCLGSTRRNYHIVALFTF